MAGAGDHEAGERAVDAVLDGVELGERAVLVLRALHGEHRGVDRPEPIGDVPRAERRRQPHVVPAAERGIDVDVVADHGPAQPTALVRLARRGDAGDRLVLHHHMGGHEHQAGDRVPGAGVEQGDRGAVAVPDEHRSPDAEVGEQCRQHLVGLGVHVRDRSRPAHRVAAAVAVAGVDDRRRRSRGRPDLVGERAPQVDRTEPLVEEHQRRPAVRGVGGALDEHVDGAAADGDELPAQGPAASCSRRAKRRILPVAVRGSWSTTTTRRGRLNAAMRDRQWASIDRGVDLPPGPCDDEGDDGLQPGAVAIADDGDLEHIGVLDEHGLDLGRRHPDATRLDHVVVAAEERPRLVIATRVDVAGAQPAVGEERGRRRIRPLPVPRRHRRPADVEVARRVGGGDLGAAVVDQRRLVAANRPAGGARALLLQRVGQEDVQRLGRADAVEHGVAEAIAEPALQVGRERLPRRHRRPHALEGVGRGASVSSSAATKPGLAKNSVGRSACDQLDHAGRGGTTWLEHGGRTRREGEGQRVAQAVGEEQLGDREAAVVLGDPQHPGGVRVGGGLEVAVAVHHPLGETGRPRAVQPEARRVGRRGGDVERGVVGEPVPSVDRHAVVTVVAADHDGVLDARRRGRDPRQVVGERRRHDDGPGAGVGDDRGELVAGEHRGDRHGHDAGALGAEEPRRRTPARR